MLTVVPSARGRLKVWPAGTVKALMFTVLHLTALVTSERDEMVPVQDALDAGAATVKGRATDSRIKTRDRAMIGGSETGNNGRVGS